MFKVGVGERPSWNEGLSGQVHAKDWCGLTGRFRPSSSRVKSAPQIDQQSCTGPFEAARC